TAMQWFTKITGQTLSMNDLVSNKAQGGFFVHTYAGTVNGNAVNVNLRGGARSSLTTEKMVTLSAKDDRDAGGIGDTSTTPGCATIDITNPQHLSQVPRVVTCQGRIEIKFTTTSVYVQ